MNWQFTIDVILSPDQLQPRDVSFVKEFVKVLEQQGIITYSFKFWEANHFPGNLGR
jgi:hypothetical protein